MGEAGRGPSACGSITASLCPHSPLDVIEGVEGVGDPKIAHTNFMGPLAP